MLRFSTDIRLKAWLLFFALPLVLMSCGRQNDENIFNVQGNWYIYHTINGETGLQGPAPALFAFSQSQQDITGTAPDGSPFSGTTSDVNISFSYTAKSGIAFFYTGTIFVNATMSGTWTSSSGNSGIWQAIIDIPNLVTVQGAWKINYATNGIPGAAGSGSMVFNLIQNNTSLAGSHFAGIEGTGNVTAVTVLLCGVGGDGATYFFNGTVSGGNKMSGTWLTDKGQSGTWSGTLQPAS